MSKSNQTKPLVLSSNGSGKPFWQRTLRRGILVLPALIPILLITGTTNAAKREQSQLPNIVLFLADDAGYSDYRPYGGEANTPTIDSLAAAGMKFSNFHVLPTCSPTRAQVITGADNHLAGLGTMMGNVTRNTLHPQFGHDTYTGHLNNRVVTIATLLQAYGYHTYHVGKWHLGLRKTADGVETFPRGYWPIDKGFEKSYGLLGGGAEHFGVPERNADHATTFIENDTIITKLPDLYFSAKNHTDKALEYIDAGRTGDGGRRKPFFLFYSDTLPHEPNQVPDKITDPINGISDDTLNAWANYYYTKGWDQVRADRLARQIALGLMPITAVLAPRFSFVPEWNNNADPLWHTSPLAPVVAAPMMRFSDKQVWGDISTVDQAKRMLAKMYAAYRGMVEYNDSQMGRIVEHLKDIGEYNNTLFIFMSDNGGDVVEWDWNERNELRHWGINNTYANLGRQDSFFSNGYGWGQVSNTPLDYGKTYMHEGGVAAPLIIAYPQGRIGAGAQNNSLTTAMDVAATILDYGQVPHPVGVGVPPNWASCAGTWAGRTDICPMNGKSIRPLLENSSARIHNGEPIGFELWGNTNKAIYLEEGISLWKLRKVGDFGASLAGVNTPWSLYDVNSDVAEQVNKANANPTKLTQMIDFYNTYEYNVDFVGTATPTLSQKKFPYPGYATTYTFTLTNPATSTADIFSFTCQSAWTCIISQPNPIQLAPGASTTITATIAVPRSVPLFTIITSQINVLRTNRPQLGRNFSMVTKAGRAVF